MEGSEKLERKMKMMKRMKLKLWRTIGWEMEDSWVLTWFQDVKMSKFVICFVINYLLELYTTGCCTKGTLQKLVCKWEEAWKSWLYWVHCHPNYCGLFHCWLLDYWNDEVLFTRLVCLSGSSSRISGKAKKYHNFWNTEDKDLIWHGWQCVFETMIFLKDW